LLEVFGGSGSLATLGRAVLLRVSEILGGFDQADRRRTLTARTALWVLSEAQRCRAALPSASERF
jgi:hypothetical protein